MQFPSNVLKVLLVLTLAGCAAKSTDVDQMAGPSGPAGGGDAGPQAAASDGGAGLGAVAADGGPQGTDEAPQPVEVLEPTAPICGAEDAPLEWSVRRFEVSGALTVDGVLSRDFIGDAAAEDVLLSFVEQQSGASFGVWATPGYELTLGAGVYDVEVRLGSLYYVELANDVVVDAAQTINFDLSTFTLSGTVTLNGQPMPESTQEQGRGQLRFMDTEGEYSVTLVDLPLTGEAAYQVRLPRGRRVAVSWVHNGSIDGQPEPLEAVVNDVPYGSLSLATLAGEDATRDFDISAEIVEVSGVVSVGGEILTPNEAQAGQMIGWLEFRTEGANVQLALLGLQPNEYRFLALDVPYDVSGFLLQQLGSLPGAGQFVVCEGCTPSGGKLQDIDLVEHNTLPQRSSVSGRVAIRGEQWPRDDITYASDSGTLTFRPQQSDPLSLTVPTAAQVDDDGSFTVELVDGVYDVLFSSTGGAEGQAVLQRGFEVNGENTEVQLQATVVPWSAEVRLNGDRMPDDGVEDDDPRGIIELVATSGGASLGQGTDVSLGQTGPAAVTVHLLAGEYEVWVRGYQALLRSYQAPLGQDVLPIGRHRLGNIQVNEATPRPQLLGVNVRTVQGTITHDSGANPVAVGEFYVLRFISSDGNAFWTTAPQASGDFEILLYDGEYLVEVGDAAGYEEEDSLLPTPAVDSYLVTADYALGRAVQLGTWCVGP